VRAGHAEVEQQQVDSGCACSVQQGIDRVGFEGARTGERLGDGELERFAKQRMVVGDEDGGWHSYGCVG
jgi:hypothetical protein